MKKYIEIILNKVKFEYCKFNEPKAFKPGDKSVYSASVLFSKDDTETLEALKRVAIVAAEADNNGQIPDNFDFGIRDGADKNNPEFHSFDFINTKSKYQPYVVVGKDKTLLEKCKDIDPNGMTGDVAVIPYPYNDGGNKGISWVLHSVWLKKDGDSISRNTSVFDGMDDSDCDEFDTKTEKSAEDELNALLS